MPMEPMEKGIRQYNQENIINFLNILWIPLKKNLKLNQASYQSKYRWWTPMAFRHEKLKIWSKCQHTSHPISQSVWKNDFGNDITSINHACIIDSGEETTIAPPVQQKWKIITIFSPQIASEFIERGDGIPPISLMHH